MARVTVKHEDRRDPVCVLMEGAREIALDLVC